MEKFMVIYCMEGHLKPVCFQFESNAIQFYDFIKTLYSAKLYRYDPGYDSWECDPNP